MKKLFVVFLAVVFTLSLMAFAINPKEPYNVGDEVENFTLMGVDGKTYTLYTGLDKEGSNGVLLMWVSWRCPVSENCNERIVDVAKFCEENNITFLAINPNSVFYDGSNETVYAKAKEANFNFPVLRDLNQIITDQYRSVATPTAILIDTDRNIRYRGRIDDNHGRQGQPSPPPQEHTLMNVLNEFLTGKELSVTDVRSPGCSIKRLSRYYESSKGMK